MFYIIQTPTGVRASTHGCESPGGTANKASLVLTDPIADGEYSCFMTDFDNRNPCDYDYVSILTSTTKMHKYEIVRDNMMSSQIIYIKKIHIIKRN